MAFDISEFIQSLTPEQQEKAAKCTSLEELVALAKDEKVALPEEALEAVAGGAGKQEDCDSGKCPVCGSSHVGFAPKYLPGMPRPGIQEYNFNCRDCGHTWTK